MSSGLLWQSAYPHRLNLLAAPGRKRKFALIEMDEILAETLDVLSYHIWPERGDRTPLDAFNRLLAKQINGPSGDPMARMRVEPGQIRSSREQRTTSELGNFPKWHDYDEPKNTDCPIIVAVYDGREYLLDGHTRINYWQRIGDAGPHDVNVHIVEI